MATTNNEKPRFLLGRVVATLGALHLLEENGQSPMEILQRHVVLDPGELDKEDRQANEEAVANDDRIFSSYLLKDGKKLWVVTEADRSSTCLLLPDEY